MCDTRSRVPRSQSADAARRFSGPRGGFSLIELLVVISIIALLLGILLPVLPKARDAGKRVACASNLRNVGQIIELYKNDFKEVFPLARYMPPPWLSGDKDPPLNTVLTKYIDPESGEAKVYKCPGDKIVFDKTYKVAGHTQVGGDPPEQKCGMSYTYVISDGGKPYEKTFWFTFLKKSQSDSPVAYDFDGGTFKTQTSGEEVTVNFFHDRRNVLFMDGHVGRYGKK